MRVKFSSIIDYVREGLDPDLWEKHRLRAEVRDEVVDIAYSALDDLDLPDDALIGLYIYGSILTNQWNPETDVDARIVLDPYITKEKYPDLTGDDIFDLVEEKIHDLPLAGTKHPFNATVVIEGEETELGSDPLGKTEYDPVYDVFNETMINPPVFTREDFDPDEEFEEDRGMLNALMSQLDSLIRETKTDVIDFEVIQDAVKDVANPDKLIGKLENKLAEIEEDIGTLVKEYADIKDERTKSLTEDPEADWRESRHWAPGNVIFKYLERYRYIDMLRKLKKIFKGGVTEQEVEDLVETLNISGKSDMKRLGQIIEDIGGPTEIITDHVTRCDWCGLASAEKDRKEKDKCPRCGTIFSTVPGGGYAEWVLDGNKKVAQIFSSGITEQAIEEFKTLLQNTGLAQDQIDKVTESLEKSVEAPATKPDIPEAPEGPEPPAGIEEVLEPGKQLKEVLKPMSSLSVVVSDLMDQGLDLDDALLEVEEVLLLD